MPAEAFSRTGRIVAIGIFIALLVDGMDFQMLALSLPALSKELHLSGVSAGALATWTMFGMGIGGTVAGWLADRAGRVRVCWWSVFVFSAFTGLIAFCQSFWQLAAMRFVSGLGLGALYCIGTLLAAEYVPTRMRTTVMGTLQAGWSVGYVIAAMLSTVVLASFGWRPLFGCAVLPGLITLALLWKVPDPPSYTASRRQPRTTAPFGALWGDAPARRVFLLWSVASFCLQFGYYGATAWLPSYLAKDLHINVQNAGWYLAGTYTMTVLGKISVGCLSDVFGRRTVWMLAGIVPALYLPFLVYAATPANVVYLLPLCGFVYAAPYGACSTYMSESFPAGVRGTGVATSYSIGRAGSMLSPLMIGYAASNYSIGLGLGLLGFSYALCALVPGLFIREKMFDPQAVERPLAAAAAV
jgi:AAHS family cis,cis-muconate transporter-like MFS transporter